MDNIEDNREYIAILYEEIKSLYKKANKFNNMDLENMDYKTTEELLEIYYTIHELKEEKSGYHNQNKAIRNRILNKVKLIIIKINSIYRIQQWYKNYLYSPKSEYYKKIVKNGENKLQEFT